MKINYKNKLRSAGYFYPGLSPIPGEKNPWAWTVEKVVLVLVLNERCPHLGAIYGTI
jgi:hypothetical protein